VHNWAPDETLAAALRAIEEAQPRCGETKVVVVDGPSGAGKTRFATTLAEHLPGAVILRMDDLYPGWDGLQQAVVDLHDHILAPLSRGEQAASRKWDWEHQRYSGWCTLPATRLLLVDGVGSGASANVDLVSVLIWLEAERDTRFRRAITRDGEAYRRHWERWVEQEAFLFLADGTRERADLIVNTTPWQ